MKMLLSLGLIALFASAAIFAEPIKFAAAGLKMDTPQNWVQEIDPNGNSVQVTSPDGLVSIVFVPLPPEALSAALSAAEKTIMQTSPDAAFGDPENFQLNGMDATEVVGHGTLEGTPVEIDVDILVAKTPVMIVVYIAQGGDKNEKELTAFVQSITKL